MSFDMLEGVDFQAADYGEEVARILDLDGGGTRPMTLVRGACTVREPWRAGDLFPDARAPEAALAGLCLYFSRWDEAHETADSAQSPEGCYWHAIVHRMEPDPGNSAYWFRRTGRHAIFPKLRAEAARLGYDAGREWDPFGFVEYCESARKRPQSEEESLAMRVQLIEWQLLFDYCARGRSR
jgi:hypothetical protein